MSCNAKIISYDLLKPGTNYDGLISRIKKYSGCCKLTESCWLVSTTCSAVQVRDDLKLYMDANDRIFVAALTGEAAWCNILSSHESVKSTLS